MVIKSGHSRPKINLDSEKLSQIAQKISCFGLKCIRWEAIEPLNLFLYYGACMNLKDFFALGIKAGRQKNASFHILEV